MKNHAELDTISDGALVAHAAAPASVAHGSGAALGESAAMISMIERAARDPNVDLDKMERLFAMHERVQANRAKAEFLAAFSALQADLPHVARKGKGHNDKRYARFEDVIETIKIPLAKHGFSLSFRLAHEERGIGIVGVLGHAGGHAEETRMTLPAEKSGSKNEVQAWGSTISYGKRYVAMTLLGIATEDDDDGQAAGNKAPTSSPEERAVELRDLIAKAGASEGRVCERHSVECLEDLTSKDYEAVKAGLFAMIRKKQDGAK